MSSSCPLKRDPQTWDYVVRSGLAGGFAGCVAKTAVAPLDRVKILFQTSNPQFQQYAGSWTGMFKAANAILRENGVRGLLQGNSATLLRVFPYAAIKFVAYDQLHHRLMPTRDQETPLRRFVAGSASGAISVFFTYPLELIRVRLAYQTRDPPTNSSSTSRLASFRPTLRHVISTVYHEGEGPRALSTHPPPSRPPGTQTVPHQSPLFEKLPVLKFYRGFSVTLLGMIPYAGTSFLVYGTLRSKVYNSAWWRGLKKEEASRQQRRRLSPIIDLSIGGMSGMISQTVSYPFEVVRRRMQVGGVIRPGEWLGWKETVADIWRKRGWQGFYVGLTIGYVKVVPMTAISFMVWEWSKSVLEI